MRNELLSLMNKKHPYIKLWPVEIILIPYLVLTGILIIVYHRQLNDEWAHLGIRGVIILAFLLLAYLNNKNRQNRLFYFFRLFFPLLLLAYLYKETDYLNNLFFKENFDAIFSRVEQTIFNTQPSLVFSKIFPENWFAELMYFGYFSYYLLILFIPLYAWYRKRPSLAEEIIFIIMTSFVFYYLVFIIIPVAGPQFYFREYTSQIPQGYVFGPLMKFITLHGEGQTGAFPSSHVSICLILLFLCFKYLKELLRFILPVSILLIFSTVYIMAHYVIDIIGAFILSPFVYLISKRLYDKLRVNTNGQHIH